MSERSKISAAQHQQRMILVTHDEIRDRARNVLADEAEWLQTSINEFIGRATMARVDLPAALYDANAELLLLPDRLRRSAGHSPPQGLRQGASNNGNGRGRWRLKLIGR